MNIYFVNNSLAMKNNPCHFLDMDACQLLAMDDLGRRPDSSIARPATAALTDSAHHANSVELEGDFFAGQVSIPCPCVRHSA
jgi:hypothetical protein